MENTLNGGGEKFGVNGDDFNGTSAGRNDWINTGAASGQPTWETTAPPVAVGDW